MQLIKRLAALISTIALAGCATSAGYRRTLDPWVGEKADDLVKDWGAPTQQTALDSGEKVFTYISAGRAKSQVNTVGSYSYVTTNQHSCQTSFVVSDAGVIESYSFKGNSCRSR